MAIDNQKASKEIVIRPGEVITIQGHSYNSLNILHSGQLEVLYSDADLTGKSEDEIIKSSVKVYQLAGEFCFNEYSLINKIPEYVSVRALQESKISVYPFNRDQLLALPKTNSNLSLYILRSVMRKINLLIDKVNGINNTYQQLLMMLDNLSVATGDVLAKVPDREIPPQFKDLAKTVKSKHMVFLQNGGRLPGQPDFQFFVTDQSQYLEKNYGDELIDTKSVIDYDLLTFLYNFMKIDAPLLSTQMSQLPVLFKFPVENSSILLNGLFQSIYEYQKFILDDIALIISEKTGLLALWLALDRKHFSGSIFANRSVTEQLSARFVEMQKTAAEISVTPQPDAVNRVSTLFAQIGNSGSAPVSAGTDASGAAIQTSESEYAENRGQLGLLKNSFSQILKYSDMPEEEQANITKIMNAFKKLPDKMDANPDARRVRAQLTRSYWNLYYHCFLKSLSDKNMPLPVKFMFKFGFVDETLLNEKNTLPLFSLKDDYKGNLEIHTTYDWLLKIYNEEKVPSINEMGLSFEKHLQEEAKSKTYAEMEALRSDSEKIKKYKTQFEINQMINSCSRVCSESLATAFPILINEVLMLETSKSFLYGQQIDDVVQGIRKLDYMVFNREVIVKTKFRVEIIEAEVLPDFIILPTVGSRIMMWQDLESNNKRSKARFAIPQFFVGDLRKNIVLSLARFRWEICKTQKGPQWADPIEGGITGMYFDYINFYKKNPNLSEEAKAKIDEHIRNYRSNRERFAADYMTYIEYESKGIAKMNKVLRDLFYRYIPFTKEVRAKLKSIPIYEEMDNKYNNVLNRKLKEVEIKFKKYEKDPEGVPQEMKDYMEMLKR